MRFFREFTFFDFGIKKCLRWCGVMHIFTNNRGGEEMIFAVVVFAPLVGAVSMTSLRIVLYIQEICRQQETADIIVITKILR